MNKYPVKTGWSGLAFFFSVCVLSFVFLSVCQNPVDGKTDNSAGIISIENNDNQPPYGDYETKKFFAVTNYISGKNGYYSLTAQKLGESASCVVYAENGHSGTINAALCGKIADHYENKVHNLITGAFGDIYYLPNNKINGNDKVVLLLLDIKDGFSGSGSYVAGYFYSVDMEERQSYSNRTAMIYLDVYPQEPGDDGFYATIAHELQHLINYSETVANGKKSKDTWIDEGLSTAAEYIYGNSIGKPDPDHRIYSYNSSGSCPTISQGNNFYVWNGAKDAVDHIANYATDYLFFNWLRIQSGGTQIYKDIIANTDGDYRDVLNAANKNTVRPSFTWHEMLGAWILANAYNEVEGLYGYGGEAPFDTINTTPRAPANSLSFAPGEGTFSKVTSTSWKPASAAGYADNPNIRYISKKSSGVFVSGANVEYPQDTYVVTYNANTSLSGGPEAGQLIKAAQGQAATLLLAGGSGEGAVFPAPPEFFPIDAVFNADETLTELQPAR
jgi:hypothetical protein